MVPPGAPLMGRPGAVLEVDRNTPPTLFHFGEGAVFLDLLGQFTHGSE